jgi:sterol desaturase/sphingolipid hydroxylase (fatty acid hydroxylase superfamily)
MGPQVHPLDVAIFGLVGYALVALLGAPPLAIEAGAFFASIVGAMHHLRGETRCGWLNRLFPFGDNHVVHHSRLPQEDGNYGNITTLFDQLFGSYVAPRVDPAPVGAWSLAPDYPQRDLGFQLRSPFGRYWQRAKGSSAPAAG